jgi:hypothetical protein
VPRIVGSNVELGTEALVVGTVDENVSAGTVISYMTVLSVAVDAELLVPTASVTLLAAIVGVIVPPPPVISVAESVHVILSAVVSDHVIPVGQPAQVMSDVSKLAEPTALENTTVNLMGRLLIGSTCVDA